MTKILTKAECLFDSFDKMQKSLIRVPYYMSKSPAWISDQIVKITLNNRPGLKSYLKIGKRLIDNPKLKTIDEAKKEDLKLR